MTEGLIEEGWFENLEAYVRSIERSMKCPDCDSAALHIKERDHYRAKSGRPWCDLEVACASCEMEGTMSIGPAKLARALKEGSI